MPVNRISAIPMLSFDVSTISNDYQLIGQLPEKCTILIVSNDSDVAVNISYNGTTDNDHVRANSDREINAQANARPEGEESVFSLFTNVWVRSPGSGSGIVWIIGYYT